MDMITRRGFIGSLAACGAASALGSSSRKPFEDIRIDRYYMLQGWEYGDTGGYGYPGYELGTKLIENMKYWEQCRNLEHTIDIVEGRGFFLSPSQYHGAPYREFGRIYLTKDWMMEFYRRHKDEPIELWEQRYDRYLADVQSGKYSPDNYIY